uniref:cytochrome-c oxidase n=1 Tax=Sphyranura euryceae TaxID=2996394 RepID=A0AA51YDW5_9PLAT|nr:cytochrome c oxidase subunit II [Sphyranura euryceae]WMV02078.1 cytochrome c oxidase subunit 2 [Sphyranura euryceae]
MSVGIYSFGNSIFSNFLSVYVVSLSIFIFLWVLISVFLNIFFVGPTLSKVFSRGSFEKLESILLLVSSFFIVILIFLNLVLLREHLYQYSNYMISFFKNIHVIGKQWYWTFSNDLSHSEDSYMSELVNTVDNNLNLFLGETYSISVTSEDVLHAFSLASADVKVDAVPGRLNSFVLVCDCPGQYIGYCSEFCGAGHSYMPIVVNI